MKYNYEAVTMKV